MATITSYNSFLINQLNGTSVVDFDTDAIKVALVSSAYVPSAATHDFWSDVTNEVTGTNYTAGGSALTGKTVTQSVGVVTFDAIDVTWALSASGFSGARYAIIYKDTGVASTSPLIAYIDFVTDKTNTSDDFTIQWGTSGIFTAA